MDGLGNILGGFLDGVDTYIINPVAAPTHGSIAEFPNRNGEDDKSEMQVEIFGMKPINFGILAIGTIGVLVMSTLIIRKNRS